MKSFVTTVVVATLGIVLARYVYSSVQYSNETAFAMAALCAIQTEIKQRQLEITARPTTEQIEKLCRKHGL